MVIRIIARVPIILIKDQQNRIEARCIHLTHYENITLTHFRFYSKSKGVVSHQYHNSEVTPRRHVFTTMEQCNAPFRNLIQGSSCTDYG